MVGPAADLRDVDGDSVSDFVVGAPGVDNVGGQES
jgi:hypothetical protein